MPTRRADSVFEPTAYVYRPKTERVEDHARDDDHPEGDQHEVRDAGDAAVAQAVERAVRHVDSVGDDLGGGQAHQRGAEGDDEWRHLEVGDADTVDRADEHPDGDAGDDAEAGVERRRSPRQR